MPSLSREYLSRLSFAAPALGTTRRLGESRGRQQLFVRQFPEQLERLRTHAVIESTESSSRIEGVIAAPGRVEDLVVHHTAPRDRSEQEIAGYRDGLQLIHESHADMPFTTSVVLQLHAMLCRYLPEDGGRWKPADNQIVERDAAGRTVRVRFTPVAAVSTPGAMKRLTSDYRRAVGDSQADPLVLVPLAVLDFLCIHPFRDGNGRIARLLSLLLLYHAEYRVGRYISLERITEQSRETYYEALERSSRRWHEDRHDPHPWMQYVWGTLLRAYNEFEERVETLKGSKTDQVRQAVLRRIGSFTISDLEADCPGVSHDMVRHVLRQMKQDGAVTVTSYGRGARWKRS
jgi:Fic family protein